MDDHLHISHSDGGTGIDQRSSDRRHHSKNGKRWMNWQSTLKLGMKWMAAGLTEDGVMQEYGSCTNHGSCETSPPNLLQLRPCGMQYRNGAKPSQGTSVMS